MFVPADDGGDVVALDPELGGRIVCKPTLAEREHGPATWRRHGTMGNTKEGNTTQSVREIIGDSP